MLLILFQFISNIAVVFFQTPFDFGEIITLVVTAVVTSGGTWLFTRKKENSEIARSESDLRRNDAETIILSGDKLINWIEKFEAAKTEAIEMEDEIAKLRRQLDKCFDYRGNCKEFLTNMKDSLDEVFSKLDSQLKDLTHKDSIIDELTSIREEVVKKLENVATIQKDIK